MSSNLSAAENRVRELEAVLSSLIPGVSLESVLESSHPEQGAVVAASSSHTGNDGSTSQAEDSILDQSGFVNTAGSGVESLPREADGFDWAEHEFPLGGLSDGMAALSIDPAGAGYLGKMRSIELNDVD